MNYNFYKHGLVVLLVVKYMGMLEIIAAHKNYISTCYTKMILYHHKEGKDTCVKIPFSFFLLRPFGDAWRSKSNFPCF